MRQVNTVTTLKSDLGEKSKTIAALEGREAGLRQHLRALESEHALKSVNLANAHRTWWIGRRSPPSSWPAGDTGIAEQQNLELPRARTGVEALKLELEVEDQHRELETLAARLAWQRKKFDEPERRRRTRQGGESRPARRRPGDRADRATQTRRAAEQGHRPDPCSDEARLLAERGYEADRLQVALDSAHRAEASLRYEITKLEERLVAENKAAAARRGPAMTAATSLKRRSRLGY